MGRAWRCARGAVRRTRRTSVTINNDSRMQMTYFQREGGKEGREGKSREDLISPLVTHILI